MVNLEVACITSVFKNILTGKYLFSDSYYSRLRVWQNVMGGHTLSCNFNACLTGHNGGTEGEA